MARRVPGDIPGDVRTFRPASFGNREDPDPIEVDYRLPTEAEKRELRRGALGAFALSAKTGAPDLDSSGKIRVEFDAGKGPNRRAFERLITAVRRYTGADGKPIDTGARLFEHGETEIVSEMAAELDRSWALTEQEKKVSSGPSGSSPAGTQASAGTAAPA